MEVNLNLKNTILIDKNQNVISYFANLVNNYLDKEENIMFRNIFLTLQKHSTRYEMKNYWMN